MPAWAEEIFGPVAPIMTFATDEEAVAPATDLGLTAAIQSGSPDRARALAARLHAGMVHINDQTVNDEPAAPFSGFGASGNGIALGGPASKEAFTEWQWLTSATRPPPFGSRAEQLREEDLECPPPSHGPPVLIPRG